MASSRLLSGIPVGANAASDQPSPRTQGTSLCSAAYFATARTYSSFVWKAYRAHCLWLMPPLIGWMCESWNAGRTMRPSRFTTRVEGPMNGVTLRSDPTYTILPWRIATDSAHERTAFSVYTAPPRRTTSAATDRGVRAPPAGVPAGAGRPGTPLAAPGGEAGGAAAAAPAARTPARTMAARVGRGESEKVDDSRFLIRATS